MVLPRKDCNAFPFFSFSYSKRVTLYDSTLQLNLGKVRGKEYHAYTIT